MDNLKIFIYLLSCHICTMVHSLPLDTTSLPDERIAIYVPYAIRYVPVEVPDEYINKNSVTPTPTSFHLEDILRQINSQNSEFVINADNDENRPFDKHNSTDEDLNSGESTQQNTNNIDAFSQPTIPEESPITTESPGLRNNDHFVVIPVKEQFVVTTTKNDHASTSTEHSTIENIDRNSPSVHVISKRQAPGFYSYRPVFRYSRISARRQRIHRPSRKHAMVGYLSDRDLFPTVA